MYNLENKNIIITGASSGIGKETAIKASEYGANLILVARNKEKLKKLLNKLKKGNHIYFSQDINEFEKIEPLIDEAVKQIGKISGFIHSAGIEMTVPFLNMNADFYLKLFSTNVIAGFEFARIISKKKYLSETGASYIFISSIMGTLGEKGKVGYCSSKSAVIGGIRAMALELAAKNIRCNCISPAMVKTEMTENIFKTLPESSVQNIIKQHPLGIGEPMDVANLCIFLLSTLSKWITGANIIIDGGYSIQ